MMREVKFRAWDADIKEMFQVFQLKMHVDAAGEPWTCAGELDTTDANTVFEQRIRRSGVFPIMQHTGIKDKNGKEIYEGDIVKTAEYRNARPSVVEFSTWTDRARGHGECVEHICAGFKLGDYGVDLELEVIGNIYENPELVAQNAG